MRVVQVSAYRDYEGCQWSRLFSTPELAYDWLRSVEADTFAGVDEVNVCWEGVDVPQVTKIVSFDVDFKWGFNGEEDTVVFQRWDSEKKEHIEVDLENDCRYWRMNNE